MRRKSYNKGEEQLRHLPIFQSLMIDTQKGTPSPATAHPDRIIYLQQQQIPEPYPGGCVAALSSGQRRDIYLGEARNCGTGLSEPGVARFLDLCYQLVDGIDGEKVEDSKERWGEARGEQR